MDTMFDLHNTKKRDCNFAVPLFEALVRPLPVKQQHHSPRQICKHLFTKERQIIHIYRTSNAAWFLRAEIYQIFE